MNKVARPKIMPMLVVALGVLAVLKVTGTMVGFSSATAQPSSEDSPVFETASAAAETPTASVSEAAIIPEIAPGEVERRILARLAARRQELEAREADLKLREAVIAGAEARLERELDAFEQEREQIEALRTQREAASSEEIDALVSAYEKMKPRDAAAIFNELDEEIMLSVASGMRTQALAGVLADMTPAKARQLTELLAKRGRIVDEDNTVSAQ